MYCKIKRSTPWEISDIPNLTGQVAIVTGGSSGIGYCICLELARKGAKVYLACRNEPRTRLAISSLLEEVPGGQFEFIYFDLTCLRACREAAEAFLSREIRLDILVNNASVKRTSPYTLSEDGIEIQACNCTGHFALTERLIPLMKKTAQGAGERHVRIINMTSVTHKLNSEPDFTSLERLNQRRCSGLERHANSMLSMIIFNQELHRRLRGTGVTCLAVHPGLTVDNFVHSHSTLRGLATLLLPEKASSCANTETRHAALTPLYAATALEVEQQHLGGCYLVPPGKPATPHPNARDPSGLIGRKLWQTFTKITHQPHLPNSGSTRTCRRVFPQTEAVSNTHGCAF